MSVSMGESGRKKKIVKFPYAQRRDDRSQFSAAAVSSAALVFLQICLCCVVICEVHYIFIWGEAEVCHDSALSPSFLYSNELSNKLSLNCSIANYLWWETVVVFFPSSVTDWRVCQYDIKINIIIILKFI